MCNDTSQEKSRQGQEAGAGVHRSLSLHLTETLPDYCPFSRHRNQKLFNESSPVAPLFLVPSVAGVFFYTGCVSFAAKYRPL